MIQRPAERTGIAAGSAFVPDPAPMGHCPVRCTIRSGGDVQLSQSAVDRILIGLLGIVLLVLVGLLIMRRTDGDQASVETETDPPPITFAVPSSSTTPPATTADSPVTAPTTAPATATDDPGRPQASDGVEGFITPSSGISDGDLVTISVSGLTPGRNATATMCWEGEDSDPWMDSAGLHVLGGCDASTVGGGGLEVLDDGYFLRCMFGGAPESLVDQCDRGILTGGDRSGEPASVGRVDDSGNTVFTYPVKRKIAIADGKKGDCSKDVCSLLVSTPEAGFQCDSGTNCDALNADLVWVRIPLGFASATPSPNAPAVLVASPSIGLSDGDEVDVAATGFTPGSSITLTLCPSDPLAAYGDAYDRAEFEDGCPFVLAGTGSDRPAIELDGAGAATDSVVVTVPLVADGPANPCRLSCFITASDTTGRSGQSAVTFGSS